ncbi:hypothetical protein CK507_14795 [Pseudomonas sp. WN033]|nr:hypothetical protein CK507_14795 [Pseudomonas sp. WN033]
MTTADSVSSLPANLLGPVREALASCPAVRQAILFGSRALGTHRPNSDIDLCLDAPSLAFADYLKLAATLDELVAPYSLDLVLMHHIENPDFLAHIQRVGVTVYP